MNEDIIYSGFAAVPADYECPDGQLATAINCIPENGTLQPILPPAAVASCARTNTPLFIHDVPGQKNIILACETRTGFNLCWIIKNSSPDLGSLMIKITSVSEPPSCVQAVGNVIVFSFPDTILYLLWRDGGYVSLGARPPFIDIDFGMKLAGTKTDERSADIPVGKGLSSGSYGYAENTLPAATQLLYSLLNPAAAEITSDGYFYQPFFVRYAYRLFDGSYCWHSAPVLMLPVTTPPIVKCRTGSVSDGSLPVSYGLNLPYFSLCYRILSDVSDALGAWSDIIAGIDFFVSAPLYTYNQSENIYGIEISRRSFLLAQYGSSTKHSADDQPDKVCIGHYAGTDGKFTDRFMSLSESDAVANIPRHKEYHKRIRDTHDFYKIAELPLADLKRMPDMASLKLIDDDLSNLVTKPTLPDDYQSHCSLSASSLCAFNSRLHLAGVRLTPAPPFSLRSSMQFGNPGADEAVPAKITVWTRKEGKICRAVRSLSALEADRIYDPAVNFPRFLYYPDASAYKMEIYFDQQRHYIVNLTPHDFLNGAYWCDDSLATGGSAPVSAEAETARSETTCFLPSRIYTSEVNNPFVFPVLGIYSVGAGEIRGISTAAKALSQGQFGQFPLYAFTTEGVWALEVSSTGTYSAKQPVTRDVCINAGGITQLDSAVLFPTDRGIMLISGSQTQCISEPLNSEYPFNALRLPGFAKLHGMIHQGDDTCLPAMPFTEFLKQCRMIYDYVHQRIIVYAPGVTYAYVYSMKSQQWGMTFSSIVSHLNSYPEALAVDKDNNIVNFSESDAEQVSCLYVTRPLKLGQGSMLKTIDTVIQRGNFARGHVATVLYGSRDLINWHLVWSSRDHYLRGFRGTPYKFFRIAGVADLGANENIIGASVQFTPRLTDQPR